MLSNLRLSDSSRRLGWLLGISLVAAAALAYWNSFNVPLFFDDYPAVIRNETIRHLWPLSVPLSPPADGSGVSGRPLVNLSLAVNYAFGGLNVRGYHLLNFVLHSLAVLTLWGVIRRTLRQPTLPARTREYAELVAWSASLLWAVHPLLTESVVCVVQRNEVMAALFYLLIFYGFIRATETDHSDRMRSSSAKWLTLSVIASLAGVMTKEIVATAPLMLWLYDRTFVAGTFRAASRQRKWFYAALAASWIPLIWLVLRNGQRGGTVGFGLGTSSWAYLLTQCRAVTTYLKLSFWPDPLVVDYGTGLVSGLAEVWWRGLIILALLVATSLALWRKPMVGFLGAWFFIILAPSSSFLPLTTQTIAEHRMYLPLAACMLAAVLGLTALMNRRAGWIALCIAIAFIGLTIRRNHDYRSEESIWSDTVAKCPTNPRAYDGLAYAFITAGRWQDAITACQNAQRVGPNYQGDLAVHLGQAKMGLGRPAEAVPYFEQMLQVRPADARLHNNLGSALAALGRLPEAIARYEAAIHFDPGLAEARNNLGNALAKSGRLAEAIEQYSAAVKLQPNFPFAEANWGRSLLEAGKPIDALPHLETALRLQPGADAHVELAAALASAGRLDEAVKHYEAAITAEPESPSARIGLGQALAAKGQVELARTHFEAALRFQPESAEAHFNLGNLLASQKEFPAAISHFNAAITSKPNFAAAHHNLALIYMQVGRTADALPHFEETLRLVPTSADVHHELALALGQMGRWQEAATHEMTALRLQPDFQDAREHLAWLQQQR